MKASVDALAHDEQQRFIELCVFAKNKLVPELAVRTLWQHTCGLDEFACEDLLLSLKERSLVNLDTAALQAGQTAGRLVSLHDLLHDFATKLAGDLRVLHQQLLSVYRVKFPDGWESLRDDGSHYPSSPQLTLRAQHFGKNSGPYSSS